MEDKEAVLLAALLHDIGKFGQRAGQKLAPEDRAVESDCCPAFKGRYSHTHVLHAGKWVRETLGEKFSQCEILALYHHAPEACTWSKLAKLVTLADRLSSGERESLPEEEYPGRVSDIPLTCLFTKLVGVEGPVEEFPMLPLSPDLTPWLLPGPHTTNYSILWEGFCQEATKLDRGVSFDLLFHQLMSLLEKHTLFVPAAAYRERPDISLYHHLKATAALAACLFDLGIEETLLDDLLAALRGKGQAKSRDLLNRADFLLVAADISGIQDFIYSVTSKHALRGLKGRSIYLELLGQSVAGQILANLRLPHANLIFQGGGNFFLLLPNTRKTQEVLAEWQGRANETLIQAHGGRLAMAIHAEQVTYQNLLRPAPGEEGSKVFGFADVWEQAAAGLARKKRCKFASAWENMASAQSILGPQEASGEEPACPVCSEELQAGTEEICPLCESFADLARQAALACFLEVGFSPPPSGDFEFISYKDALRALGVKVRFLTKDEPISPEKTVVLNAPDLFTSWGPCRGFTFMAHHVPRENDGNVKTLEDLAQDAAGIKKWGLLRADVDNLGQVFTVGLGKDDRSLSRLSTLSYLLSLFFNGYLQSLVQREYEGSVYLVYAGGDDLCLLGPWSVLPDLARRLKEDFNRWTRSRLTVSGGLYLAPRDKFPVYRAAGGAGELLDLAKQKEKNQLGVFDQAVTWDDLETLVVIKDQLVTLLDEHQVPKSLLLMLRSSWLEYEQHSRDKERLPMYRVWRLLYGLRRLTERLSRDRKMAALPVLQELEKTLIVNHYLRPHTDIAVRWAEYLIREGG